MVVFYYGATFILQIRALVNSELEACLVLHESKEFWQQRLDRSGSKLLNWIEMGERTGWVTQLSIHVVRVPLSRQAMLVLFLAIARTVNI